ncbi:MAG: protein phosphatase 2C domain-containing protein [Myxococcales bacterium]|nr:protein phosphatase 2C domain-containing protein [Myxococcales bacterium]
MVSGEVQVKHVRCGRWSERGLRLRNEDYAFTDIDRGILIIADGMGGHAHGDAASREAVERCYARLIEAEASVSVLTDAFRMAHDAVSSHGDNRGTTLTVALMLEDRIEIGHVGDTRLYINGQQITVDQGIGHVLEEFVGGDSPPLVQRHTLPRPNSGWLILTTDGVHDTLPIPEHFPALLRLAELVDDDPEQLARTLSQMSVQLGSSDNCTVVAVHMTPVDQKHDAQPVSRSELTTVMPQ